MEVHSISSDDTSQGKEVADVEAANTAEQPVMEAIPLPTTGQTRLPTALVAPMVVTPRVLALHNLTCIT